MKNAALSLEDCHDDAKAIHCQHCGLVVPIHRHDGFCCSGCRAVHQLLRSAHLDEYYRIRQDAGVFRAPTPVRPLSEKLEQAHPFLFLDDPGFRQELGIETHPRVQFYLEGIHCTACLWLIEKIPELLPDDVTSARLDLQNSVVDLVFKEKGSISNTAEYLDHLGYRPHAIFSSEQKIDLAKRESRLFLARVALAGALMGNIMIFAISIYAGASGFIKDHFDWIILFLSLPVFLFSAVPLYQNAWNAIRNRRWSVDIPIVIALAAGLATSGYSIFTGGNQNYLDSLSGLVFLLLASRYFLMRLQKNAFRGVQFSESFYPVKILRNQKEYVWVKELKVGDEVEIPPGFRIPIDGVIVCGQSQVNESIMSGESMPKRVVEHEAVFAGSINSDSTLWVKVNAVGDQTRIGKIAQEIQKFEINRSETVKFAEKVAQWFTVSVLLWSSLVFGYFLAIRHLPWDGLQRILSILIVSCPCAFAIATPLALIQAFQILMKRGLYLKDPNDIEKVLKIEQIAFDKTGTLTEGVLQLQEVQWKVMFSAEAEDQYLSIIRSLEEDSKHPIARAFLRYLDSKDVGSSDEVENIKEISGQGISGTWKNRKIELKACTPKIALIGQDLENYIRASLLVEGKEIAQFLFSDRLRADAKAVVSQFQKRGLPVWMLSGDHASSTRSIATSVGLSEERVLFELSPEGKASWLQSHPGTLYIGDGANDGLALNQASLGIAAHGALDLSMKAASIYLTQNKLQSIIDLFTVSKETKKILNRHLVFTIVYNTSTIALASLGMLKPLIAAVLMPLSSLLILFSTQIGTKRLRSLK